VLTKADLMWDLTVANPPTGKPRPPGDNRLKGLETLETLNSPWITSYAILLLAGEGRRTHSGDSG